MKTIVIVVMGKPFSIPAVEEVKKAGFDVGLVGTDVNDNLIFNATYPDAKQQTEKFLELCNGLTPVKTVGHNPEIDFYCYRQPLLNCFYILTGEYFEIVVCGSTERFKSTERFIEQNFFTM